MKHRNLYAFCGRYSNLKSQGFLCDLTSPQSSPSSTINTTEYMTATAASDASKDFEKFTSF